MSGREKCDNILFSAMHEYMTRTSEMMFVKDLDLVYVGASQPFVEMAGWKKPEDIIGKTDFEIFPDRRLAQRYVSDDRRLLASGAPLEDYIEPIVSRDRKPRYSSTSKYIIRDAEGRAIGIYGVGRDISGEYEARLSYERELWYLFHLPVDVLAMIVLDVTAWRVLDIRCHDEGDNIVSRFSTVDEYLKGAAEAVAEDETARQFFAGLSQESARAMYEAGRKKMSFEYLYRTQAGGGIWVRSEMLFLTDPINDHLSLAIIIRNADDIKREREGLLRAAETDLMTGLLNHDATIKHIVQYLCGAETRCAMLMIDLDNFKQINDTFGHKYGDGVLTDAAAAVKRVFRASDITGRIGGDEFMVLMKGPVSAASAARKANELLQALQFSCSAEGRTVELSVSIGIAMGGEEKKGFEKLYSEADSALYRAKSGGKNRFCVFGETNPCEESPEPPAVLDNAATIQYWTLLEHMDGGVIVADVGEDIHISYVSPSFYRSMGRSESAADGSLGEKIASVVDPKDRVVLRRHLFETAATGKLMDYSFRVSTAEGTGWRHIRAARMPSGGDSVQRIIAVVTDITELKKANEQLSLAEETYQIAVKQAGVLIWKVDLRTHTLHCTGDFMRVLGRKEGDTENVPESIIENGRIHADSVAEYRRLYKNLYAGQDGESYYIKFLGSDGQGVWGRVSFKILRDKDGAPYYSIGTVDVKHNIDAEMRRFERECCLSGLLKPALRGTMRVNISADRIEDIELPGDPSGDKAGTSYDEFQRDNGLSAADGGREAFEKLTSRGYLVETFRRGESWQFIEYRGHGANGAPCWMNMGVKLIRHPVTGDLYAFIYIRDNDIRHRMEASLPELAQRDSAMLLYTRETLEAAAHGVLAEYRKKRDERVIALTVMEITGLDQVRAEKGSDEAGGILSTMGRLCRILIGGQAVCGRLDETRVVIFRTDAGGMDVQRARLSQNLENIRSVLQSAHAEFGVGLICGTAVGKASEADYATLLSRAAEACSSARTTPDASVAVYGEA